MNEWIIDPFSYPGKLLLHYTVCKKKQKSYVGTKYVELVKRSRFAQRATFGQSVLSPLNRQGVAI